MRTRGAGTRHAVVQRAGHGPLASSPRCEVPPSPSRPYPLLPQHLTVTSSCAEMNVRVPHWLRIDGWGESFIQGLQTG